MVPFRDIVIIWPPTKAAGPPTRSCVPLELPTSPMRVLPVRIEHALDVTDQGPQHADPRNHGHAADRDGAFGLANLRKVSVHGERQKLRPQHLPIFQQ